MAQVKQLMDNWLRHRNVLEELLKLIDDEHLSFKPWDGAFTLGELVLHVVQWNDVFVTLVKTGEFTTPVEMKCQTMEEIRKVVRQFTEKSKATYAKITDEDLEIERVFALSNFKAKGKTFLTMMYDHEIHHKGQLFVYTRMAGVKELPFFRDFK